MKDWQITVTVIVMVVCFAIGYFGTNALIAYHDPRKKRKSSEPITIGKVRTQKSRFEVWKKSFYTCKWECVESGDLAITFSGNIHAASWEPINDLRRVYKKPTYRIKIIFDYGDGDETITEAG